MAIYVPASRRRRSFVLVGAVALVVGLLLGGVAGRATAPSVGDRISSVRTEAQEIAAGLRVVSLHEEAGAESLSGGDAGAALALRTARARLVHAFGRAPWLPAATRRAVLAEVDRLAAHPDATSARFASDIDALADRILTTFGAAS